MYNQAPLPFLLRSRGKKGECRTRNETSRRQAMPNGIQLLNRWIKVTKEQRSLYI